MSATSRSLGQSTVSGAMWLMAMSLAARVIGFGTQLLIAGILSPQDFGLIGLAFTVSTCGAILVNSGVESVLLQRERTMQFWMVPAFWYSFSLGVIAFLVVAAVGPIAAHIYHLPEVAPLALIIAIGTPISALATLPNILLRARFQFRLIAGLGLAETLGVQGLTIAFALSGFGAYAFALPLPLTAVVRNAVAWGLTRPDLTGLWHKIGRVRYLAASSTAVFATGIVQSAISQGDYVVLGLFATDRVVGVYFFAFKLASQPLLLMATSLSGVLLPALSQLRKTPEAQAAAAFRAARLLGLLIMPLAFLQAALIEPALHLFFASKWDASIPLMQILSIAFGFDAIAWIAGTLVAAQRGFQRQLLLVLMFSPAFFVLIVIGGWHGSAIGVAAGVTAYYALVTPIYSYVAFRRSGLPLGRLLWFYYMPAAAACVAVGAAVWLTAAAGIHQAIPRIAVTSGLTAVFYAALLRMIQRSAFDEVRDIVLLLARRRARARPPAAPPAGPAPGPPLGPPARQS